MSKKHWLRIHASQVPALAGRVHFTARGKCNPSSVSLDPELYVRPYSKLQQIPELWLFCQVKQLEET